MRVQRHWAAAIKTFILVLFQLRRGTHHLLSAQVGGEHGALGWDPRARTPPAALHAALASSRRALRRDHRSLAIAVRMEARGTAQGGNEAGHAPMVCATNGDVCVWGISSGRF
jgi:hypothetical protein